MTHCLRRLFSAPTFGQLTNARESNPLDGKPHDDSAVLVSSTLAAIGVVRISIQAINVPGRRIRAPFVRVHNGVRQLVDSYRIPPPNWFPDSSRDLLLHSLQENLDLDVFSYHRYRTHSVLGQASLHLDSLQHEPRQIGREVPILRDGTPNGTILFDVLFYPTLQTTPSAKSSELSTDESLAGIATLRFQEVAGISWEARALKARALSIVLSRGWTDPPIYETTASTSIDPPSWESEPVFEFMCDNKRTRTVIAKVVDFHNKSTVFGHLSLSLDELLEGQRGGYHWWPLSGSQEGKLCIGVDWQPVKFD